ncbi:MAG TPA: hypothetical protein VFC78_02180 [Tepidisphaeraceae bacterium]|nr:hypothetical protein [Tepidisphaeraceae bacterium]
MILAGANLNLSRDFTGHAVCEAREARWIAQPIRRDARFAIGLSHQRDTGVPPVPTAEA